MMREKVLSVEGWKVITETGAKLAIGNRPFSVGEYVWTDNGTVFGHEPEANRGRAVIEEWGPGFFDGTDYLWIDKKGEIRRERGGGRAGRVAHDESKIYFFTDTGNKIKVSYLEFATQKLGAYSVSFAGDENLGKVRFVGVLGGTLVLECFTSATVNGFDERRRYRISGAAKSLVDAFTSGRENALVNALPVSPSESGVISALENISNTGFNGTGATSKSIAVGNNVITASVSYGEKEVANMYKNHTVVNEQQVFGDGFSFVKNYCFLHWGYQVLLKNTVSLSGINVQPDNPLVQQDYIILFDTNSEGSYREKLKNHFGNDLKDTGLMRAKYLSTGTYGGIEAHLFSMASYSFFATLDKHLNVKKITRTSALVDGDSLSQLFLTKGYMGVVGENGVFVNTTLSGAENYSIEHEPTSGPYTHVLRHSGFVVLETQSKGLDGLPTDTADSVYDTDAYSVSYNLGHDVRITARGRDNGILDSVSITGGLSVPGLDEVFSSMPDGSMSYLSAFCVPTEKYGKYFFINGQGHVFKDGVLTKITNAGSMGGTQAASLLHLKKGEVKKIQKILSGVV